MPFSFELRKALFRQTREFCPQPYMLLLGILPARFDVGLIVDRIARHFFASRSPNASGFFLKRLSRLCVMFSLGLRSCDKGMASSRVGQCGAQGFESASRNGEDRSPAAAVRPG